MTMGRPKGVWVLRSEQREQLEIGQSPAEEISNSRNGRRGAERLAFFRVDSPPASFLSVAKDR
jgi:hypothetical protein